MEKAFLLAYQNLDKELTYIRDLKYYFIQKIKKELPQVRFNGQSGSLNESTYTIVNISLPVPEKKADIALLFLDIRGIAVSRGSACQSGSVQSSHVLRAILPEEQWYEAHLRFSFSIFNTKEEIDYSIEVLKEFLQD